MDPFNSASAAAIIVFYHNWIVCKVRQLHISPPLFITVSCIVYFSCHTVITVMFICCVDVDECDDVQLFIRPHKSISLPSTLLLSIVGAGATILDLFIDCNTVPAVVVHSFLLPYYFTDNFAYSYSFM